MTTAANLPALPIRLSPSRAKDYKQCPRQFYYKSVLRLPDPAGLPALQGTVSHEILELLMQRGREDRTPDWAIEQVEATWQAHYRKHLERGFPPLVQATDWIAALRDTGELELTDEQLAGYDAELPTEASVHEAIARFCTNAFTLERLTNFDPAETEQRLEVTVAGVPIRGVIDRLDRFTSNGVEYTIISDYKTGKVHNPRYERSAFFAMRIYALMIKEAFGVTPYQLRLIYLREEHPEDGISALNVTEQMLDDTRRELQAIWAGIKSAHRRDQWPTQTSKLCDWCAYQDICPEFADEIPPLEEEAELTLPLDRPR